MRKVSLGFLFLILWMLTVSTGLYLYIFHLQPTKLGNTVSSYLKEKTQLEFNIESIGLSFTPSPAIVVNNAKFYDTSLNTSIFVKKLEGVLSWRSLFMLKPVLKRLNVDTPVVHLVLPEKKANLNQKQQTNIEDISKELAEIMYSRLQEFSIPHYFTSLQISVSDARGEIAVLQSGILCYFENFSVNAKAPDIIDGYADLQIGRLDIVYENSPLLQLTDSKIQAANISYNPRTYSGSLLMETNIQAASLQRFYDKPINPAYTFFPMPKPSFIKLNTDFSIAIRSRETKLSGTLENKTLLPMNGYAVPIELHVPFALTSTFEKKNDSSLHFPENGKTADPYKDAFLKENQLSAYALSLPGFYINEITINNAKIKADADSLDFTGAVTGLYPPNPLIFGTAKVHKFSLPRWIGPTRNMSAGLYNALDRIQAEIEVFCTLKGVYSPKLKAKVLNYAVEGKSVTANFLNPDICFDLNLIPAGNAPIDLNPLFPEINGKSTQKVQLPPPAVVVSDKQNGKQEQNSISVAYHINISVPESAHIWKIDCSDVSVLVAPDKNNTPSIAVDVNNLYTGKAKALALLNSSKKHKITAQIHSVLLEAPLRSIMGYTAATGHADADITLFLDGSNMEEILNSLEINANAAITDGALHSKQQLLTKFTRLYAAANVKTVPFKAQKAMPETFSLFGSWNFEGDFPAYSAKLSSKKSSIQFSTENGRPTARSPQPTTILLTEKNTKATILNGTGDLGFQLAGNAVSLKNYKGMLRHSKLIADVQFEEKNKSTFSGNLYFQHFDLSDYLKSDTKKTPEDKDLPLDFICDNDIDFKIKADKLTFYDITTRNFTGNIKIKDSKISINNLKTNSKNGIIQALLEGSVTKNKQKYTMQTLFKMKADNIDMLNITKMRKQKTLMAGTGNIAIQGNALLSKSSDIFKTMNADWSMSFVNGYFQSAKENSASRQSAGKNHFNNLSASGTVKNGIAETHNIILHGNGLDILAGGTVNLVTEKINAYAKANYLGFSDIPITITGTIDKPEYEVKVLNAVSKTIGNIGTGIFDVFSSVIIQPFKFFMQQ